MARVVLVGLGHAHLHVASRAAEFRAAGHDLTLIDPGTFWYSSIASGLLGGRYERGDDVIEADAFAAGLGIGHVAERAVGLDRTARTVGIGWAVVLYVGMLIIGWLVRTQWPLAEGAQLAFCTAGAYCAVLANHYNGRALPAEVLLEDDGTARLIRPAVSDEDMIAREQAL